VPHLCQQCSWLVCSQRISCCNSWQTTLQAACNLGHGRMVGGGCPWSSLGRCIAQQVISSSLLGKPVTSAEAQPSSDSCRLSLPPRSAGCRHCSRSLGGSQSLQMLLPGTAPCSSTATIERAAANHSASIGVSERTADPGTVSWFAVAQQQTALSCRPRCLAAPLCVLTGSDGAQQQRQLHAPCRQQTRAADCCVTWLTAPSFAVSDAALELLELDARAGGV